MTSILRHEDMRVCAHLSAHHLLATSFPLSRKLTPGANQAHQSLLLTQILGSPIAVE